MSIVHGTVHAYVNGKCRCQDCRTAAGRYNKRLRLEKLEGIERLVDAAPLHAHVQSLRAAGMSEWGITRAAGWRSRWSLHCVLGASRVTPATMARVLRVRPADDARPLGYVDATGSRRRLQALALAGWRTRDLSTRAGQPEQSTVCDVLMGRRLVVRRHTADAIAALHDELWDQAGPSIRTARKAARSGWVPSLAWDDDSIDDPAAVPNLGEPTVVVGSGRPWEHVLEDYQDTWPSHHGNVHAAAHRLGMSVTGLEAALRKARDMGVDVHFTREAAA